MQEYEHKEGTIRSEPEVVAGIDTVTQLFTENQLRAGHRQILCPDQFNKNLLKAKNQFL